MSTFMLTIKCDNAAFREGDPLYEVGRILVELGKRAMQDDCYDTGKLQDANGNTVGSYKYAGRPEPRETD